MNHIFVISIAVAGFAVAAGEARAADGFASVSCGKPVPAALMGKHMANEPVAALEARHRDIALRDLGASEINDQLTAISWMICGSEYMLLQDDKDIVRDVLPFPAHSRDNPEFLGVCRLNGKDTPEQITAVLNNKPIPPPPSQSLPAIAAWKIDEAHARFVKIPTEGLTCPRSGIVTADGGN